MIEIRCQMRHAVPEAKRRLRTSREVAAFEVKSNVLQF